MLYQKQQVKLITTNLQKSKICIYDLYTLHGQVWDCHFLIDFVKVFNDVSCLNSLGIIFKIFGAGNEIHSSLQKRTS